MKNKISLIDNKNDFALYLRKIIDNTHIAQKQFLLYNNNIYSDKEILNKARIIDRIEQMVENNNGEISQKEVFERNPHIQPVNITKLVKKYSKKLFDISIGDILFFKNKDLIDLSLPNDFCEVLNKTVVRLHELDLKINEDNLNVALSLSYNCNFRRDYNLENSKLFSDIIKRNSDIQERV